MKKLTVLAVIIASFVIPALVIAQVCPAGMVSYWKFDEGSGTTAGDSIDAHDGTLINGPVWTSGQVGGALSFDGVDDYLFVPDSRLGGLFESGTDFTIEMWIFKIPDKSSPILISLMSNNTGCNGGIVWTFYGIEPSPTDYGFVIENVVNCDKIASARGAAVPHNQWIFGTVVYQDGNLFVYANGQLVASNPAGNTGWIKPSPSKNGGLFIGTASHCINPPDSIHHFTGMLDEIAVYNRAITPQEIYEHYQKGMLNYGYCEELNAPPTANAGVDQTNECSSYAGTSVILDGSGSTDPDSTPSTNDDIIYFDWYEDYGLPSETFLGDGEIIDYTFPPGTHTITLLVTDSFGETDEDEVIKQVIQVVTVNTEKAKVCWHHDDLHMEGKLNFPEGVWMDNLSPVGRAVITLAGVEVADQSVYFEIKGKKGDKWEYKDKKNLYGSIKEFKVDWKEAKFDYHGDDGFHIHTHFIGEEETTLCIHTGHISGAFTVNIDGTTIAYDEERNIITTDIEYEPQKEDNTHVHFTLPFQLTSDMTIEVSGAIELIINVADYYKEGYAKFKLVSIFDSGLIPDGSGALLDELEYKISLGDGVDMISGSDLIDSWIKKDDKHWKYK